ncbi:hypothetical protein ACH5RR_032901 [Cinchona calisaya]|uniref:Uncharacterized protein n=1 Tax=Cinchona calisaya TaxID=153742 RepID=A0ABD2YNP2_9GENT
MFLANFRGLRVDKGTNGFSFNAWPKMYLVIYLTLERSGGEEIPFPFNESFSGGEVQVKKRRVGGEDGEVKERGGGKQSANVGRKLKRTFLAINPVMHFSVVITEGEEKAGGWLFVLLAPEMEPKAEKVSVR